jgi:hypothetical protein
MRCGSARRSNSVLRVSFRGDGSARTFALQPVSVEGSVAVNVALGVSALKLRPAL